MKTSAKMGFFGLREHAGPQGESGDACSRPIPAQAGGCRRHSLMPRGDSLYVYKDTRAM